MANGIIRTNPIGRFALWDMRTDAGMPEAALGAEFWDATTGLNGNASGAGFTVTVAGATGAANSTANAVGAGFTVTLTGATGTASSAGNGNATGAGFEITLTGANGTASGTANGNATGAAFSVTLTGATGAANATANAIGAGFTVTLGGATGTATGTSGATDGNATGGGFTITVTGANGGASGTGADAGSGGGFIRRVKQEQENRRKLTLKKDSLTEIRAIVDDANIKGKALKQAYSDVKGAQKELFEAEQRLILFLEGQELELLAQDELELIKVIAELL